MSAAAALAPVAVPDSLQTFMAFDFGTKHTGVAVGQKNFIIAASIF